MKPEKKACEMTARELAAYIDQSVLKPEFTQSDIRKYIQEGIDFGCKTVCVNPSALPIARKMCEGTQTGVCVVCDFPFGLSSTASKALQAEEILKGGGVEDLDVVANYGWIRSGLWDAVQEEIRAVAEICHRYGALLKVIFETDALTLTRWPRPPTPPARRARTSSRPHRLLYRRGKQGRVSRGDPGDAGGGAATAAGSRFRRHPRSGALF
jgi:deoxyribose-phosphate aldolase